MIIREVSPEENIFRDVLDLHRENSATLGHLPYQAFITASNKKELIVAIDDDDRLLGYLLYRIAITKNKASITHLCISQNKRGKGVARKLVDYLKSITGNLHGIFLYSKRSYDSHSLWPNFGFIAKGEKYGRGKDREPLTYYWFQQQRNTDLFEWANQEKLDSKQYNVVLDANIFYDFYTVDNPNEIIQSLNSDWIVNEVTYCLTQEIYNEIDRKDEPRARKLTKSYAEQFPILPIINSNPEKFNDTVEDLKNNFFSPSSPSDYSDINQLAYAIIANANFFLTCDEEILKKSDSIFSKYKLEIFHPSDFVAMVYDSFNDINYRPAKLAGSNIQIQNLDNSVSYEYLSVFQYTAKEKKNEFQQKIRKARSHPEYCEQTLITRNNDEYLAMMIIDCDQENILDVPIIRITDNELNETICTHMILEIIEKASERNKEIITISDNCLSDITAQILQEHLFDLIDNQWVKITITDALYSSKLYSNLIELKNENPLLKNLILSIIETLTTAINIQDIDKMVYIEQKLWPIKILDANIPTFIVPIQPKWAKDLFDKDLGSQTLFGSKLNLVISRENVYYRSAHSIILESPARILWYISGDKNFQNVQAIKYCSYVTEIQIDIPKELYKKNRRLGIYEFNNLVQISKGVNKKLMSFRFSGTSKLQQQIPLKNIKYILGNNGNIQAPRRITLDKAEEFFTFQKGK